MFAETIIIVLGQFVQVIVVMSKNAIQKLFVPCGSEFRNFKFLEHNLQKCPLTYITLIKMVIRTIMIIMKRLH